MIILKITKVILKNLPLRLLKPFARCLAYLLFLTLKRERRIAENHIKFCFPKINPAKTLISAYENSILSIIEIIRLSDIIGRKVQVNHSPVIKNKLGLMECENLDFVNELIQSNTGAICLSCHYSNFDLMASFFSLQGIKMNVLARSANNPNIQELLSDIRSAYGIKVLWRNDSSNNTSLLRALKNKEMVCALIDQDVNLENAFHPFFGLDAAYPIAPIKLAIKLKRPIVFTCITRKKAFKSYSVMAERITWENEPNPLNFILKKYNDYLENLIRQDPSQWVWWHKRWRRRPGIDYQNEPNQLKNTKDYLEWFKQIKINT